MTHTIKTSQQLEELLSRKEYKAAQPMGTAHFNPTRKADKAAVEGVITYGDASVTLFDDLTAAKGTIPTPAEFLEAGMPIFEQYWNENRFKSNKIGGRAFNITVKQCVAERINRVYASKVVELHTELVLTEMGYKVYTNPYVDSYMGVDLIAENGRKRYYIHITSSKDGKAGALASVKNKERRNRMYPRDFAGDVILSYDRLNRFKDGSTKFINNIPLLKRTHIDAEMFIAQISKKHGEPLDVTPSKIEKFRDWMQAKHNIAV